MSGPAVLIIGAGVGGIATAARLARQGCRVTVVEKHNYAGGRCGHLVRDGHRFDTGPTLFVLPSIFGQTFADLGEEMRDHLDLHRVDPTYRVHMDDGTTLALTGDLVEMKRQLEAIEPGSFAGFLRYLDEARDHKRMALPNLVDRSFDHWYQFYNPRNLWLLFRLRLLVPHYRHMLRFFCDRRLKAAFTFQDLYLSLSPFHAPATYSMLPYAELAEGVWFPMGGIQSLVRALTEIGEKHGVRFVYDAPVERIDVETRRAAGVTLADGSQLQADVIVANADLPYVYRSLLPEDGIARRLERKRYACSAFTFYWGVDRIYSQFGSHSIFLAGDYRSSFDQILNDLTLPDEPSFYLHAPARSDPSRAPHGQDTLMAVVPVGHIDARSPQDWPALQARARRFVLDRLARAGADDLERHIKFEVGYTPPDWQDRYNLTHGSTLGLAHDLLQMGYLRPHNRHRRYRNLYFVGASTQPGSGLPVVLISARLAAQRIMKEVCAFT